MTEASTDTLLSLSFEAGRASMFNEIKNFAINTKRQEKKNTLVTVIWNDCNCQGDTNIVEIVEISDREDVRLYPEGIVRQGMRNYGYNDMEVNEAIRRGYGLVGIIKGKVEWMF